MVKQVMIVNMGLDMEVGRIAAQVAHASIKVFLDKKETKHALSYKSIIAGYYIPCTKPMVEWIEKSFTKVVVGVDNSDQLFELANKAKEAGLPFSIMTDNGFPDYPGGVATTCVAIGPADSNDLDPITGDLSPFLEEWYNGKKS